MLEYEPSRRITASEAMNDPWILDNFNNSHRDNGAFLSALNNLKEFRSE